MKKKYVILTPTNKSADIISPEAQTIHKFIAKSFNRLGKLKEKLEKIDWIIVDEISMIPEKFYHDFLTIKRIKPTIQFILSGDFRQCQPVQDRIQIGNYKNTLAIKDICDNNRLEITECRRSDKKLYNLSLTVMKIKGEVKAEIATTGMTSICWSNAMRMRVNKYWMDRLTKIKATKYISHTEYSGLKQLSYDGNSQDMNVYKGLPIIARVTNAEHGICNAQSFIVQSFDATNITISKGYCFWDTEARKPSYQFHEQSVKQIPIQMFSSVFQVAYCVTTHRVQGDSIDRPFVIYEWTKMSEDLRYTALTRATKAEYVAIMA